MVDKADGADFVKFPHVDPPQTLLLCRWYTDSRSQAILPVVHNQITVQVHSAAMQVAIVCLPHT